MDTGAVVWEKKKRGLVWPPCLGEICSCSPPGHSSNVRDFFLSRDTFDFLGSHQISVPSGNLNLTLAVAPRASPIFSHSSTVNFPVFNRLFKSCGDQPRRRASSEFDTPQYPVAISTICRAVTVNHLHASSINYIISKVK